MENELLNNIKTFLKSADLVYKSKDYTSATILYFKSIFVVFDLIILKAQGKTPKDHTERFRILQASFPDLYETLDKYFSIYRDTYSLTIDKETCERVKNAVNKIIEAYTIPI